MQKSRKLVIFCNYPWIFAGYTKLAQIIEAKCIKNQIRINLLINKVELPIFLSETSDVPYDFYY